LEKYLNFLKVAFQNRRKVLFKKLKGMADGEKLKNIYKSLNLREDVRIDGLSREVVFKLYLGVAGEKS